MTALPAMRSCRARCSRCTRMPRKPRPRSRKLRGNTSARTTPPPWVGGGAISADDVDAEHGHAERPAARRPRIAEVEKLPQDKNYGDGNIRPAPVHRMAGHDLHHQRGGPEDHRKQAGADHRVKDEGQEPDRKST